MLYLQIVLRRHKRASTSIGFWQERPAKKGKAGSASTSHRRVWLVSISIVMIVRNADQCSTSTVAMAGTVATVVGGETARHQRPSSLTDGTASPHKDRLDILHSIHSSTCSLMLLQPSMFLNPTKLLILLMYLGMLYSN